MLNIVNVIITVICTIVIVVCSIGIIVASRFQNKQKKKYDEIKNIINKGTSSRLKYGLTKEDINNIDSEVDVDLLMKELYNTYLDFENRIKTFDTNLDDILVGYLKNFYITKIQNYKESGFSDIIDEIELLGYYITDYSKEKLKFRININCFSYKGADGELVGGSNLEKVEQLISLEYKKVEDKWLISSYEKIYEKKLSN